MTSTTADNTTATLRCVFSAFGLPKQLVANNGPQFVSREFADFMQDNGIKLMLNHHTVHRRFHLLVPRKTLSQWRHVIAIPGASVTQLTDMAFLN